MEANRYTTGMMNRHLIRVVAVAIVAGVLGACAGRGIRGSAGEDARAGHLLIIGGGLDDDNRPVYERFVSLARGNAGAGVPPRVVIATTASLNEEENAKGKRESIRAYCPECVIDSIGRGTGREETIALVDKAHAMFFTGGDQKRITMRYLDAEGRDTEEAKAMRRLLARGGVIAGTSAGDAMMSDPMFFTGRSAEALGIRSTRKERGPDDDADEKRAEPPLGPRIGKGMGFLPWAVTDSHFFERHRFGRLVAALEASGTRLGIGVGEDACAEVDLATGELIGVSVADSLLVDVGGLERQGLARRNVRARVIRQGTRVSLPGRLKERVAPPPVRPGTFEAIPVVEPGQNRQLASWRFFLRSQEGASGQRLELDGYAQAGWPDGNGWSVVEITPTEAKNAP